MKKLTCVLLTAALLFACACGSNSSTADGALEAFDSAQRLLVYRYYYIKIWESVCVNSLSGGQYGLGEPFNTAVPPDEQYYYPSDGSEKHLWSEELAAATAGQLNEIFSFYDDALKNGYTLDDEQLSRAAEVYSEFYETAAKSPAGSGRLEEKYGEDFTPELYDKILKAERVLADYPGKLESDFIEKRAPEYVIYEKCSELAVADYSEYAEKVRSEYTQKMFADTADTIAQKETALKLIRAEIERRK